MIFDPVLLAEWTKGKWQASLPHRSVTGFSIDTRTLKDGDLFVALKTENRDGHEFLAKAKDAGAVGALVNRQVGNVGLPQLVVEDSMKAFQAMAGEHRSLFPGPIIGITGSCGKTSTKDIVALLLGGNESVLSTHANLNNTLGVPLTLLQLNPERHQFGVVEAGISLMGEMKLLGSLIRPDITIVTMIGAAHLDGLKSLENVADEKLQLALAGKPDGLVVFPYECFEFAAFQSLEMPVLSVAREGFKVIVKDRLPDCVYSVRRRGEWSYLFLRSQKRGIISRIRLRSVSDGMISNVALSIVTALELGVEASVIAERVEQWAPAKMRGQVLHKNENLYYIDCYNANPDSMRDAIKTFSDLTNEKAPRIYFIGCMEELGEKSDDLHFSLGQEWILSEGDQVVIMGSQAEALRDGLLKAGNDSDRVKVISDINSARHYLDGFEGAVFLKGSRRYHLEEIVEVDTLLKEERVNALC